MKNDLVERIARILCKANNNDPEHLEPGDAYKVDGTNQKGEPVHKMWREYCGTARKVIRETLK